MANTPDDAWTMILDDSFEEQEEINLVEDAGAPWEKKEHHTLGRDRGSRLKIPAPEDLNRAESERLEVAIRAIGMAQGASVVEQARRVPDPVRARIAWNGREKGFIFADPMFHDWVYRTVDFTFVSGGVIAALKLAQPLILQWLKNRGNREVVLKRGNKQIRLRATGSVDEAIATLEKMESQRDEDRRPPADARRKGSGKSKGRSPRAERKTESVSARRRSRAKKSP